MANLYKGKKLKYVKYIFDNSIIIDNIFFNDISRFVNIQKRENATKKFDQSIMITGRLCMSCGKIGPLTKKCFKKVVKLT